MNIMLIGFPGCGKTSIGKELATLMGYEFVDTDRLVEQHNKRHSGHFLTAREIYKKFGEVNFRKLEKEALHLLGSINSSIIATGGGLILDPDNVERLKNSGKIIYLINTPQILFQRLIRKELPPYLDEKNPWESFEEMYLLRDTIYRKIADLNFDTANWDPKGAAEEIAKSLNGI